MAEKIIPDVEFFAQEITQELKENLPTQRGKIVERLINFSPEKISELHLQDWYGAYWKLLDFVQYINEPPQNRENLAKQLIEFANREQNPVKRQYIAFALLLCGKIKEFNALINKNLWSKNLREDFDTFFNFNKLTGLAADLRIRANVRRNQQIKNFLFDKYADLIKKYADSKVNDKTCPKVSPKHYQIYFCWMQGEENLPPVVQCCYNSLKFNAGKYKIVFIDEKNFADYVTLPEHILKKFSEGKITRTHFSDIIRVNLLEKFGGLWLDSTVLVTEPLENYKEFWKMPFFSQKFYQEKSNFTFYFTNPAYGRWATFILGTGILHNPFFALMKDFYNEYWKEYDEVIDYVLMDFMMDLAYENIHVVKKFIDDVPINNDRVWNLLRILNLPYSQNPYEKIFKGNFLNKLSWKANIDLQAPGTVFAAIRKKYLGE